MNKIEITTSCKKLLADIFTPVGIYLRLRDRFRDTILLESTDHHAAENSYSFICVNAIGGIEISNSQQIEFKLPGQKTEKMGIKKGEDVSILLQKFMQKFIFQESKTKEKKFGQGLFGYTTYDAVQFFETIKIKSSSAQQPIEIPLLRYRFYQYVLAFNHFNDELYLLENKIQGLDSDVNLVESLIKSKDVPVYPFKIKGDELSNLTDNDYLELVNKGIWHCRLGDVFQIVLSRKFQQKYTGDDFNVYRALRSINPSPYLFYFDYGDYKLMGSSPEAQIIIQNGNATLHPIAGTFKRTGNDEKDAEEATRLLNDKKENAEHVMLVDLARNDLSKVCDDVSVTHFKKIQYYSHVIHLVSEVIGKIREGYNPFDLLAKTFPAGTLSGAPKFKAMELIDSYEPTPRGFYGGAIGFIGFDGSCNHAIMIRTFMSKNNTLSFQAGAGVVVASNPENELQEVNNKLNALRKAISFAENIK
ncbi:MAG: anthranilate synthase component I family protein [Chitinophagaceae bacterium]|nr:MAG: anthranilate synthase component I family protein [Chitinophagaceae bacterium]